MFTSGGLVVIATLLWFSGYLRGKRDGYEAVVESDGGDFIASPSLHSNFLLLLMAAESPILFPDISDLHERVGDQLRGEMRERKGQNLSFNCWIRNTYARMLSLVSARQAVIFLKELHRTMNTIAHQDVFTSKSATKKLEEAIGGHYDTEKVDAIGAAIHAYIRLTTPILMNTWDYDQVGISVEGLRRMLHEIVSFADIISKRSQTELGETRVVLAESARGLSKHLGIDIAQPFDDIPRKNESDGAQPAATSAS